jgi:hypothetical protein
MEGGPGRGVSGDGGVRGLQDRDDQGGPRTGDALSIFKRNASVLPLRVDIEIEKKTIRSYKLDQRSFCARLGRSKYPT